MVSHDLRRSLLPSTISTSGGGGLPHDAEGILRCCRSETREGKAKEIAASWHSYAFPLIVLYRFMASLKDLMKIWWFVVAPRLLVLGAQLGVAPSFRRSQLLSASARSQAWRPLQTELDLGYSDSNKPTPIKSIPEYQIPEIHVEIPSNPIRNS